MRTKTLQQIYNEAGDKGLELFSNHCFRYGTIIADFKGTEYRETYFEFPNSKAKYKMGFVNLKLGEVHRIGLLTELPEYIKIAKAEQENKAALKN